MLISLKLQVSRQMFLKRIVLKICLYKFLCTKFDLPLQPYPINEIMILTNLNLYYLRMLSHKFRLIWPICFWKNVSYCFYEKKLSPNCNCNPIISPKIMIQTNMNQFSLSPHKFQHFWTIIFWEDVSKCFLTSPQKKAWPYILTYLNFLYKMIVCARFCWNLV